MLFKNDRKGGENNRRKREHEREKKIGKKEKERTLTEKPKTDFSCCEVIQISKICKNNTFAAAVVDSKPWLRKSWAGYDQIRSKLQIMFWHFLSLCRDF